MAFTAVFDADVLHPAAQRDLLVRLAQVRLFRGRWTERILEEMERSVVARQPQHAGKLRPRTKNILTNPTGSSDWASITRSCRSDFAGVCPRLTMNSAQMTQPIPRVTPTVDESCSTPITTPTACHSSTSSAAGATVDDPSARGSPAAASRRASRSVWSSSVALISRNPACISARRLAVWALSYGQSCVPRSAVCVH